MMLLKSSMVSVLGIVAYFLRSIGNPISLKGRKKNLDKFDSTENLIERHFTSHSHSDHICKKSISLALKKLDEMDASKKITIVETGSSAWGTNSSILFDAYLSFKNCDDSCFFTCDIRIYPMIYLLNKVSSSSKCVCDDSIAFLSTLTARNKSIFEGANILFYLDSFDLDFSNPHPSGLHGLKEFLAIEPILKNGALLLIDDTPFSLEYCPEENKSSAAAFFNKNGYMPGKGMFVNKILESRKDVEKLFHGYQALYRFL